MFSNTDQTEGIYCSLVQLYVGGKKYCQDKETEFLLLIAVFKKTKKQTENVYFRIELGNSPQILMDNKMLLSYKASLLYFKLFGTPKPKAIALSVHYKEMSSIYYAYQNPKCMVFFVVFFFKVYD